MPSTVHPEILVVVDDEFFRGMDRDIVATQEYVVSFLNAVNMRFATVRQNCPVSIIAYLSILDDLPTCRPEHCRDRGCPVREGLALHRLAHQQRRHARRSRLPPFHGTVLLQASNVSLTLRSHTSSKVILLAQVFPASVRHGDRPDWVGHGTKEARKNEQVGHFFIISLTNPTSRTIGTSKNT